MTNCFPFPQKLDPENNTIKLYLGRIRTDKRIFILHNMHLNFGI